VGKWLKPEALEIQLELVSRLDQKFNQEFLKIRTKTKGSFWSQEPNDIDVNIFLISEIFSIFRYCIIG
jgi:hypothetical protein